MENRGFIANVGDSRAIMSGTNGEKVYCISRDHRPNDEKEYARILEAGGKIYQTEANIKSIDGFDNIIGPLRVVPGKLSVSRAIGDIEAKHPDLGGNPNVIIALPEIKYFDINSNSDFIVIGCDGVFEKMKNKEIVDFIWKNSEAIKPKDIHHMSGILVEKLVNETMNKKSTDNITTILICLKPTLEKNEIRYNPSHTQQVNKIPKSIITEEKKEINKNTLTKFNKMTQLKTNEKFISINK
jgi:protein phosphatase 2C family protein 2/3